MRFQAIGGCALCVILAACPAIEYDQSACIEPSPTVLFSSVNDAEVEIKIGQEFIELTVDEILVKYSRVGAIDRLIGLGYVGQASITVDEGESGFLTEVHDSSGRLVLRAGLVGGIPDRIRVPFAASVVERSGPCTADPKTGFFAGVEFRLDEPRVLAAGTEDTFSSAGEQYVGGAPWAFVVAGDNSFSGWAYLAAIESAADQNP